MSHRFRVGLALLVLVAAGCSKEGKSEQAAIGMWKGGIPANEAVGIKAVEFSLEMKADKSFVMKNSEGSEEKGTWSYEEGIIHLLFSEKGKIGMDGGGEADRVSTVIMSEDGKGLYKRTSDETGKPDFVKVS